ncbi:MAG: succinate dehydrogenase assembly factor 4 [Pseudomonadota bacterium]
MTKPVDPSPKTERAPVASPQPAAPSDKPAEHGGPKGPEPTRYGDWERNGRCSDF